jgi:ATP-dependent DNA helicase UvrD/PcrA
VRLVEGSGSYLDHERSLLFFYPEVGKTAIGRFHRWCYHHGLNLPDALQKAMRFPVPELSRMHQHRLNEFNATLVNMREATVDMSVSQKIAYLMGHTKFRDFFDADAAARDVSNLIMEMAQDVGRDVMTFLSTISLGTDTDVYSQRAEKVFLMTMHAAKGLEFPVVFIAGCEDGWVPYQRFAEDEVDHQEERRLFYVAMTRAMDRLYLTTAKKRRIYGKTQKRVISPFVADIENQLKSIRSAEVEPRPEKAAAVQLSLFK